MQPWTNSLQGPFSTLASPEQAPLSSVQVSISDSSEKITSTLLPIFSSTTNQFSRSLSELQSMTSQSLSPLRTNKPKQEFSDNETVERKINYNSLSHSQEPSLATIVEKEVFRKIFSSENDNVNMGHYIIAPSGDRMLYTTGVATCIAVLAEAFKDGKCVQRGVYHHDSLSSGIQFLKKMTVREKGITELVLRIYGGYGANKDDVYGSFENNLNELKNFDKNKIKIQESLINPWEMPESYEDHEQANEEIGFSLSAGITKEGKVYVSDESNIPPITSEDPKLTKPTNVSRANFIKYLDPNVQELISKIEKKQ
jgi:hypothetical protein